MSLRFLHLADLHIDASHVLDWRVDEQEECLQFVNEYADKRMIKDVFISGDVFNRHNPDAKTISLFLNFVKSGIDLGLRYWVVPGNHDAADPGCSVHSMSTIKMVMDLSNDSGRNGLNIFDRRTVLLDGPFEGYQIFFMPWMNDDDYQAKVCEISEKADDSHHVTILVTHCFVKGALINSGMSLDEGVDLSIFDGFNYVALGDVHFRQEFKLRKGAAHYSGSFYCVNFGERKQQKGFLDVKVSKDGKSLVEFVPVPHVEFKQRAVKLSSLRKILNSKSIFKKKFGGDKFLGKALKLKIDCEGGNSSRIPYDDLMEAFDKISTKSFEYELTNTGYVRQKRLKGKTTADMMDEMVDKDKSVKGKKRKQRTKKAGKSLMTKGKK